MRSFIRSCAQVLGTSASFRLACTTPAWQPVPNSTQPWQRTLEVKSKDLCRTHLQRDRMEEEGFFFFDTKVRFDVRQELASYSNDKIKSVFVTGPGGTGKSHNLAVFALEMRADGHFVMYLSDMEAFLEHGTRVLFGELDFAWRKFKEHHSIDDARRAPVDDMILSMSSEDTTPAVVSDRYDDKLVAMVNAFRRTVELLGKRVILIIDQDNRLSKRIQSDPQFVRVDVVLCSLPCHNLVLCASANNEGWERRTWKARVYHGIDAVPEEILRSHWRATDNEIKFLSETFNHYPLPTIGLLSQPYRNDVSTANTELELTNREKYANSLRRAICTSFDELIDKQPLVWLSVLDIDQLLFDADYDKRYMTIEGDTLRAIYPLAREALESVARRKMESALINKYKVGFSFIAQRLFSPKSCHWTTTCLVRDAVPSREVIEDFRQTDTPHKHSKLWIEACHGCPNVDFYLLEKSSSQQDVVNAVMFQLPWNNSHVDCHSMFAGGNNSMLNELRANGVNGNLYFVYVSPHMEMKDMAGDPLWKVAQADVPAMHDCGLGMLRANFSTTNNHGLKLTSLKQQGSAPYKHMFHFHLSELASNRIVVECLRMKNMSPNLVLWWYSRSGKARCERCE